MDEAETIFEKCSRLSHELSVVQDRVDYFRRIRKTIEARKVSLEAENSGADSFLSNVALSREFYRKAVDMVYESSVGEIEHTINAALEYIFFDKNYKLKLDLGDKRSKSL